MHFRVRNRDFIREFVINLCRMKWPHWKCNGLANEGKDTSLPPNKHSLFTNLWSCRLHLPSISTQCFPNQEIAAQSICTDRYISAWARQHSFTFQAKSLSNKKHELQNKCPFLSWIVCTACDFQYFRSGLLSFICFLVFFSFSSSSFCFNRFQHSNRDIFPHK